MLLSLSVCLQSGLCTDLESDTEMDGPAEQRMSQVPACTAARLKVARDDASQRLRDISGDKLNCKTKHPNK